MAGEGPDGRAVATQVCADEMRDRTGYDGPLDIVCHSIGSCIARQWLEAADGAARPEHIHQLIMLGPPNNGSALAELFSDPARGPEIVRRLAGVFVPPEFDPFAGPFVQDVRLGSPTMQSLQAAGFRNDIANRESALPGVPLEALASGPDGNGQDIPIQQFCHIQLPPETR